MKVRLLTLALAAAVATAGWAWSKDDAKNGLVGTWQVAAAEYEGAKTPGDRLQGWKAVFTADRLTVRDGQDKTRYDLNYRVGAGTDTKAISFTVAAGDQKGQASEGIYKLDGDTLTICFAEPGGAKPTEFKTAAGSKQVCFSLRRSTEK